MLDEHLPVPCMLRLSPPSEGAGAPDERRRRREGSGMERPVVGARGWPVAPDGIPSFCQPSELAFRN